MNASLIMGSVTLCAALDVAAALAPPPVIPFDAAYMVSAPTSETAVSSFSINGAQPTLFVDLPGSSPFTFLDSTWFFGGIQQFTLTPTHFQGLEQFWMQPTENLWSSKKAVGTWVVNTRYSFGDILFAENGGIGVGITTATGAATVVFAVTTAPAAPVPLPGAFLPFVAALAGLRARTPRP